ncbi:hypothetical protein ACLOJK_022834 [Asimina triloba]
MQAALGWMFQAALPPNLVTASLTDSNGADVSISARAEAEEVISFSSVGVVSGSDSDSVSGSGGGAGQCSEDDLKGRTSVGRKLMAVSKAARALDLELEFF